MFVDRFFFFTFFLGLFITSGNAKVEVKDFLRNIFPFWRFSKKVFLDESNFFFSFFLPGPEIKIPEKDEKKEN